MVRRHLTAAEWEAQMQPQTIVVRNLLSALALFVALALALVAPLTARADDEPRPYGACWSGSYAAYWKCVDDNVVAPVNRQPASSPALATRLTLARIKFMEDNLWGADFAIVDTDADASYFPSPDDASLIIDGIVNY
jgi:hypothetical protein